MHNMNVESINVTASGRLVDGPCWLHYARISKNGGGYQAALYDGADANGQLLANFHSTTQEVEEFSPARPVYCRQGLYVSRTASDALLVQFEPEPAGPPPAAAAAPAPAAQE